MLTGMTYGTYLFFGILTYLGAAFIWWFFPETKGLSLEEMDILFGSVGFAAADAERMRAVNREVGLDDLVHGDSGSGHVNEKERAYEEKTATHHVESGSM